MEGNDYGFWVDVPLGFERTEETTRRLLKERGFGVLTEIDVRVTLKEKLGVDRAPYRILGACNPRLAHRALEAEPGIGVLLPCNVVVEGLADGSSRVRFMDPEAALGLVGNTALTEIAGEAKRLLSEAAASLEREAAQIRD